MSAIKIKYGCLYLLIFVVFHVTSIFAAERYMATQLHSFTLGRFKINSLSMCPHDEDLLAMSKTYDDGRELIHVFDIKKNQNICEFPLTKFACKVDWLFVNVSEVHPTSVVVDGKSHRIHSVRRWHIVCFHSNNVGQRNPLTRNRVDSTGVGSFGRRPQEND